VLLVALVLLLVLPEQDLLLMLLPLLEVALAVVVVVVANRVDLVGLVAVAHKAAPAALEIRPVLSHHKEVMVEMEMDRQVLMVAVAVVPEL
jgi:hypothetical protein